MSDYCAKADIHARLQDLSTDYDTLLDSLCTQASRIFDRETGRGVDAFAATSTTKYLSGSGRARLFIPELNSLTTLRVRSSVSSDWRSVPLTPAEGNRKGDLVLEPEDRDSATPAHALRFIDGVAGADSVFPAGDATVEIVGSWGYATTPGDVKEGCVELVVAMLRDRGIGAAGSAAAGSLDYGSRIRTYPDLTWRAMQSRKAVLVA